MKKLLLKIANAIYKFCGIATKPEPVVVTPVVPPVTKVSDIKSRWERINDYLMRDMPTLTEWPEMSTQRSIIDKSKGVLGKQNNNWPFVGKGHWSGYVAYDPEHDKAVTKEYEPINLGYHKIVGKAEDIVAIPLSLAF